LRINAAMHSPNAVISKNNPQIPSNLPATTMGGIGMSPVSMQHPMKNPASKNLASQNLD
jgi:hypothetical protein